MHNRKRLLFTLFCLLGLVLLFNFVYSPISETNSTLEDEVTALRSEVSGLRESNFDQELDLELGELESKLVQLAIPDYFDQDELIKQMSQLAGTYNINVDSISFVRKSTDNQFIDGVQLNVSMDGGLFSFIEFLRTLENQQRFYEITDVNVGISKDEPKQVNFNATMIVYHS